MARLAGSSSDAARAAASCSASAPRSGWTRSRRSARRRTRSSGRTSSHVAARRWSNSSDWPSSVPVDASVAMESIDGRRALDPTTPPGHDAVILPQQRASLRASRFLDDERHQRRRIPVLHRPSSRSETTTPLALRPLASCGTGAARKRSTSRVPRGGSATPRCTSAAAASSTVNSAVVAGLDPGHRLTVVRDEHGLPAADLIEKRAEAILRFAHTSAFHRAILAQNQCDGEGPEPQRSARQFQLLLFLMLGKV